MPARGTLGSMRGPIKHRSAGIVVVRRQNGEWRLLILRAYRNWDFPKGLIEPSESPLAAARRETTEETGLADLDFRWGTESVDTVMPGSNSGRGTSRSDAACFMMLGRLKSPLQALSTFTIRVAY